MTTVDPVSSKNPETSRKSFNEFHFKVLNSFNLDEFKKFTNFPQLLKETIKQTLGSAPDRFSFEDRIRHHFRRSISNEEKWQRGLFNGLKLTEEFYGSDAAKRIFKKSYGVRGCEVRVMRLPTESGNSADLGERLQELSSDVDEENAAVKIDLTMSDESSPNIIDPPKRLVKVKYPRKQGKLEKSKSISGSDTYTSPAKSVERIPTPLSDVGFDEETIVSSTEPAPTSSKRISVISNVLLVPPTPFRDETIQRQPDHRSHSSRRRVSKQEFRPKSKNQQRGVFYTEDETEEMPEQLPVADAINEKPKSQLGPKSQLLVTYPTTQDLLQDLMDTNPPSILTPERPQESSSKVSTPATKPRVGPKSVMLSHKHLQLPLKELSEKSVHHSPFIEPVVQTSSNVVFAVPKPKVGPKSRTRQLKSSSIDSNGNTTQDANPPKIVTIKESDPLQMAVIDQPERLQEPSPMVSSPTIKPRVGPKSAIPDRQFRSLKELPTKTTHTGQSIEPPPVRKSTNIDVPAPKSKIEFKSEVKSPALLAPTDECVNPNVSASSQSYHSSKSPPVEQTSLQRSQIVSKSTGIMDTSEIPSQSCHMQQTQANTSLDSLELSNNINRSIERAKQHLTKYFADTDRNVRSMKHFWNDFLRYEFEEDSSEAETQLIATPDDVELEVQSQAILQPNQIHADNAEEAHMELHVDHIEVHQIDVENVSDIPIEPQASVIDPHPVRCAEHSDVKLETKIKVELVEYDHNETHSSDVQIIELPPEEIIEISGDETQQLFDQLQVDRNDSEELPIEISLPTSKTMSSVASSSKGFLTSLPVIASKKRNYQPLDIVVEPVQKHPPMDLLAFSQQHLTPPSFENYQIEECTMSESQHQRQDS
ncbi:hypothetical protein HA402_015324 [Bradysia odoriphaga]|nr:hypothetical protein HA402_015324 [Bradysia odoriphaga]